MANPAAVLSILVKANGISETQRDLHGTQRELRMTKAAADDYTSSTSSMNREMLRTKRSTAESSRGLDKVNVSMGRATDGVFRFNQASAALGNTMKIMKWPALLAAVGPAAEGLQAAAGGAAALTGALAPSVGLLTQYGTALGTLGQVKATLAISGIKDVTDVIGGLGDKIDKTSDDFKNLTPQAQKFAETLDRLQSGPLTQLQEKIQGTLFGSLSRGINEAMRSFSSLRNVLVATGGSLGVVAEMAGKFVGSKSFGADFSKFGLENARVIRVLGGALINLGKAFLDVMVVARPLTKWITDGIASWSAWIARTAQAARSTGALAEFFRQTKDITGDLVSILSDVGMALWNIIKIGQPLGNAIVDKLVQGAQALRDWTESAKGRNAIAQYFKDIKPVLFEVGRLAVDLTKTFFNLGQGAGLKTLLKAVRTDLLPIFERLAKATGRAFGPAVMNLVVTLAKLFGHLAGTSGPLTLYVRTLSKMAEALNWMIKNVPGFKTVIVTLLGLKAVGTALSFMSGGGIIGGLKKLKGALFGVAAAEGAVAGGAGAGAATGGLAAFSSKVGGLAKRLLPAFTAALVANQAAQTRTGKTVEESVQKWSYGIPVIGGLAKKVDQLTGAYKDFDTDNVVQSLVKGNDSVLGALHSVSGATRNAVKRIAKGLGDSSFQEAIRNLKMGFGSLRDAASQMSKAQVRAWQALAQAAADAGVITQKRADHLSDALIKGFRRNADVSEATTRSIKNDHKDQQHAFQNTSAIVDKTTGQVTKDTGKMSKNVGQSYKNMVNVAQGGMKMLQDDTNKALAALGLDKAVQFRTSRGAPAGTGGGSPAGKQRGGHIGGPSVGDTIPLMAEGGEFMVNSKATKRFRPLLEKINNSVPRFAKGGKVPGFAKGGGLDFALGPQTIPPIQADPDHQDHIHVSAFSIPWLISVGHKIQQLGNTVGEFQPTSQGNPYHFGPITTSQHAHYPTDHYSGHAIDVNSNSGPEDHAWEAAIARVLGGAGVTGAVVEKIKRVILKGPKGPVLGVGQGALDHVWKGANKFLAKQAPAMAGIESGVGAQGSMSPGQIASLWTKVNDGLADANTMARIAMAESSGNPSAIGHDPGGTTGYGLWQITSGYHDDLIRKYDPILNTTNNALAAASIFRNEGYGAWSASSGNWRKGGMIGMPPFGGSFGRGGTVPGPLGAPRTIVAHGGERVGGDTHVHVNLDGSMAALFDLIDSRVDAGLEADRQHRRNEALLG